MRIVKKSAQHHGAWVGTHVITQDVYLKSDTIEIKPDWIKEKILNNKLDICDLWISTCENRDYDGSRYKDKNMCMECRREILDHFEVARESALKALEEL